MEKSTIDNNLPKYYKGYDVDILLDKEKHQQLSIAEVSIIDELYNTYYQKKK